jgi:hypothetical protein
VDFEVFWCEWEGACEVGHNIQSASTIECHFVYRVLKVAPFPSLDRRRRKVMEPLRHCFPHAICGIRVSVHMATNAGLADKSSGRYGGGRLSGYQRPIRDGV